jgi:hypothetical protein
MTINPTKQDKDLARGEFGELILHLLLRDFHDTVPLLSKIYFKDPMEQQYTDLTQFTFSHNKNTLVG